MSLRSFERMSPEKVYPMYPATEHMEQPSQRQGRAVTSGGSIMNTVKMQQLDSVEDEQKYLKQPNGEAQSNHDDSMAKMNSGGGDAMMQAVAVRFSSTPE